jgi:hypothetical protein
MSDDPILSALARLEAGQADVTDRLTRLDVGQRSLRADFFSELGATRGAVTEKLTDMQSTLTDIRDDIAVTR